MQELHLQLETFEVLLHLRLAMNRAIVASRSDADLYRFAVDYTTGELAGWQILGIGCAFIVQVRDPPGCKKCPIQRWGLTEEIIVQPGADWLGVQPRHREKDQEFSHLLAGRPVR